MKEEEVETKNKNTKNEKNMDNKLTKGTNK